IRELMDTGIQLVVLGMGEAKYTNLFSWAESEYPGRLAARFAMNHQLAHRIYAGADMFLMPSQFEPCGLSQLISLRYGTVPIVRETGGLRDTVLSYNKFTDEGNGFSFFNYNAHDMLHTVRRAVHYYKNNREVWYKLIVRGMTGDYSWYASAAKYMEMYDRLVAQVEEAPAEVPENPNEAPAAPEAPVEAPVAEAAPVVEEAPAAEPAPKKRAPRKKAAPKAEEAVEAKEEAPKKRAPRKKKTEEVAAEAPAEAPKKRAPRKKKAEETAAETPAEAPKKRAPRKKKETPAE
ncbi:MAG: glycosyltransferase, partial [Clostridia bacterium]|nr:glycosyltransferase [Clostridia bacterium]